MTDKVSQSTGWRPIDTAPKDGTAVLIWDAETRSRRVASFLTAMEDGETAWVYACSRGSKPVAFVAQRPTLWQPLPPCPEGDDGR